jgi:transposase
MPILIGAFYLSPFLLSYLLRAFSKKSQKVTHRTHFFKRIARRRGKKRAIIALAHTMLVIIYHMIKNRLPYNELGDSYFNKMDKEKLKNTMVKRLEKLGYKVDLSIVEEQKAA